MPTYDYVCDACEHQFELFQSITARPIKKCPKCGRKKLRRLIGTGGGVIFKGSGFYETDYRSESYKKAAEAEKKASAPATDKKADKPKSKPAKKSAESSAGESKRSSAKSSR